VATPLLEETKNQELLKVTVSEKLQLKRVVSGRAKLPHAPLQGAATHLIRKFQNCSSNRFPVTLLTNKHGYKVKQT